MAQEQIQESYYSVVGNKWIDIHQSVKTCIEVWLSKLLFQGDLSRVIYSVPDITFRRRIELLDKGKTENDELTPISLNLPYASYYQSTDWVDDDRGSTQQAAQALIGEYDQNTYHRVRSLACKSTYKIQAFFSRRDDVRVAQQLIRWEQSPKTRCSPSTSPGLAAATTGGARWTCCTSRSKPWAKSRFTPEDTRKRGMELRM